MIQKNNLGSQLKVELESGSSQAKGSNPNQENTVIVQEKRGPKVLSVITEMERDRFCPDTFLRWDEITCDGLNMDGKKKEGEIKVVPRYPAWLTRWTVMLFTETVNAGEFPTWLSGKTMPVHCFLDPYS